MKIIKQEIKEKSRKLTAKWTLNQEYGPTSIHNDLIADMSQTIQEEIDWEIMCDLMKSIGWTQIDLEKDRMSDSKVHKIKEWCRTNLTGIYRARGRTWIFSKEKDAVLFSLKWV